MAKNNYTALNLPTFLVEEMEGILKKHTDLLDKTEKNNGH